MTSLHLGILAHVDAGKTSLTERLLLTAGVIPALGSVDAGTTQTDSLALERRRGITIRAAVVSFPLAGVPVNLIDTPGHPDFIAEVERSLAVLDGAVLVISAVEGVQPQTVVLMRALQRLRVPTLLFVNKIDRPGADPARVIADVRERLTPSVLSMGRCVDLGTSAATFIADDPADPDVRQRRLDGLAQHDDDLLLTALGLADSRPPSSTTGATPTGPTTGAILGGDDLTRRLADQVAAVQIHPVYAGSAVTGVGVGALVAGVTSLLPRPRRDPDAALSAQIFAIQRDRTGAKVACVRVSAGTLRLRDRVGLGDERQGTVTGLRMFRDGTTAPSSAVAAGGIGAVQGLRDARVGDVLRPLAAEASDAIRARETAVFAPPTMESLVVPRDPSRRSDLHRALTLMAEQDPLIDVRRDAAGEDLFVTLYGEVQREVLDDTLRTEFGIEAEFRATSVIHTEVIVTTGRAELRIGDAGNPHPAGIGLRIGPAAPGSGIVVGVEVAVETLPLYVFKSLEVFRRLMAEYAAETLDRGLRGHRIADAEVTVVASDYISPSATAADLRKLVGLVLPVALERAGTLDCEPVDRFRIDTPTETIPAVFGLLGRHRGLPDGPVVSGRWSAVTGLIPAAQVQAVRRELAGTTHGSGVLDVRFDHWQPLPGRRE